MEPILCNRRRRIWFVGILLLIAGVMFVRVFHAFYLPLPVTRVLCEVRSGDKRLYVQQRLGVGYSYYIHGITHLGPIWGNEKVIFDDGTFFGKQTLFPSEQVDRSGFSKAICYDSRIIGQTVYIYPLYGLPKGYASIVDVVAVSEDNGRHFELRPIPDFTYPPVAVDSDGYAEPLVWSTVSLRFETATRVVLEQQVIAGPPTPSASCPSPGCPAIIMRRMVSHDAGNSWLLTKHQVLRPDLLINNVKWMMKKVTVTRHFARSDRDAKGNYQSSFKILEP